jgi:hypothetical protein
MFDFFPKPLIFTRNGFEVEISSEKNEHPMQTGLGSKREKEVF